MSSRETELYKDRIEVSLDGRQIFYLFFGGAVIVGMVFILGVMIGRRVEARGHVEKARTHAATDPLAALDRLETTTSFQNTLAGAPDKPDELERAIAERVKKAGEKPADKQIDKQTDKPSAKLADKPSDKPSDKAGDKQIDKPTDKLVDKATDKASDKVSDKASDKPTDKAVKVDAKPAEAKKPAEGDKLAAKPADKAIDKPTDKPTDKPAEAKKPEQKFTLQLSSFQDKAEAETFLSAIKAAGYQAYVTEAAVSGKGTFYRVRLGKYASLEAANDAKLDFETKSKKSASVMKL